MAQNPRSNAALDALVFTPTANFSGIANITETVNDGTADSAQAVLITTCQVFGCVNIM